jgi:hypothetical protein
MKPFLAGLAWLVVAVALRADPAVALRQAVDDLFKAGNYSWRESRSHDINGRSTIEPYAFGRTVIDGYTIATVYSPSVTGFVNLLPFSAKNVRAIFLGSRTAFELESGWRRYEEMTPDELQELYSLPRPLPPLPDNRVRIYNHASLHEALRVLLPFTTSLREEDGAIVGILGLSNQEALQFDAFMRWGMPPRMIPMPETRISPLPDSLPHIRQIGAAFKVWLVDGKLSKVEFAFAVGVLGRGRDGKSQEYHQTRVYTFELQEVGTTHVDVTPEMRALFNDTTVTR